MATQLDRSDISNEDFIIASSYTPVIDTQATRKLSAWEWLRVACECCARSRDTHTQPTSAQQTSAELLREVYGQGQVCTRIGGELFVGSGSLCLLGPAVEFTIGTKFFFLTCAHNFIHSRDQQSKGNTTGVHEIEGTEPEVEMSTKGDGWQEATAAVCHYAKTGPGKYAVKAQVLDFRIHPKYFLNGHQTCAGFDIAVGLLEGNFENAPSCENSYWSYYEYQAPQSGDNICVVGYPAEKAGYVYKMCGTLSGILDAPNGGKLLIYENINTHGGQSGAPVFLMRSDVNVLIGVHLGYDAGLRANVAAMITKEIYEWIYSQVNSPDNL